MSASADVYAMSNPAFCAAVLSAFATGYRDGSGEWPRMPVMFLPIPLVLSHRVARTFKGTNRRTGLLEWLAREPQVATFAGTRIRGTKEISRRALLFGLRYDLLGLDEDGRLTVRARTRKRLRKRDIPALVRHRLRIAARLGTWIGEVGSPATVFHSFGIVP